MPLNPRYISVIALAAVGLLLSQPAKAGYLNLTNADSSGEINGAIYTQGDTLVSGTGVFPSFVQIKNQGHKATTEKGYNTTVKDTLNNGPSDQHNHEVLVSDLAIVTIGGKDYYKFYLDINENKNATGRYLSLDRVQVYTSASPNQSTTDVSTLGTLRYDSQGNANDPNKDGVLLDYSLASGSGKSDMSLLVPIWTGGETYLYLYSEFGAVGKNPPSGAPAGNYGISADFEEWAYKSNPGTGSLLVETPAPAGLILLATAMPVLGLRRLFRRKPAVA